MSFAFLRSALLVTVFFGLNFQVFADEQISRRPTEPGQTISVISAALLGKVTKEQKVKLNLDFNSKKRTEWRYFPEPSVRTKLVLPSRSGVPYVSLAPDAKHLVDQTLSIALSAQGLDTVKSVLELEKNKTVEFRGLLNTILFRYGPENYFVTVFGTPGDGDWAWRFEGHHISINLTFSGTTLVSTSPLFLGTTLGSVTVEDKKIQVMSDLTAELKRFASSLTDAQKTAATQSLKDVPKFNPVAPQLFGGTVKTKPLSEKGLEVGQLSRPQIESLKLVLGEFAKELNETTRGHLLDVLTDENLSSLHVVWAGDFEMKSPFYLRLQSSKFVFELNTSEGHADHYHVAWINL